MGALGGSPIEGRWIVVGSGSSPTAGEAARGCVTNVVAAIVQTHIMTITLYNQTIIGKSNHGAVVLFKIF